MISAPHKNNMPTWPEMRWTFADAARAAGADFGPNKAAESRYERQITSVAEQVERIMREGGSPEAIERKLREYAEILDPWAKQSAANMAAGVNHKNVKAWRGMAGKMGLDMRRLIDGPGIGAAIRKITDANVAAIKSLALGSADTVAAIAREGLVTGSRADDLAKRIAEAGEVSLSKARTIARTEVSKAQTALTMERARSVGSTGYIWRTARDGDTRDSHRNMEGVFVPWDDPPTLDGMTGHAGEFPNDRCYAEPVVPREDGDGNKAGVYKPALPTAAQERLAGEKRLLSTWERQETSSVIPHAPGQPLYNVEKASMLPEKLSTYALDRNHPRGGDKATAFHKALGFENTPEHRAALMQQVLAQVRVQESSRIEGTKPGVGEQFRVQMPISGPNGKTVVVKTNWIYERDEKGRQSTSPRLTSIMVKKRKGAHHGDIG